MTDARQPAPADIFRFRADPGDLPGRRAMEGELVELMCLLGARAARFTRLDPGERAGYPGGYYAEGWRDVAVPRLHFGARAGDGRRYPPVLYDEDGAPIDGATSNEASRRPEQEARLL